MWFIGALFWGHDISGLIQCAVMHIILHVIPEIPIWNLHHIFKSCFWMVRVSASHCFSTWRTEPPGWPCPAGSGSCGRGPTASGAAPAFSGRSCGLRRERGTLKPSHMSLQKTCKGVQKVNMSTEHSEQSHNRSATALHWWLRKRPTDNPKWMTIMMKWLFINLIIISFPLINILIYLSILFIQLWLDE